MSQYLLLVQQPKGNPGFERACRNVLWYIAALVSLFQIAWMVAFINKTVRNLIYPKDTFLYVPSYRFTDMTVFKAHFSHFGQGLAEPGWYQFSYPPFSAIAFLPFLKSEHPVEYYTAVIIAAIAVFGFVVCWRARNKPGFGWLVPAVIVTAVFTYPFMILWDRANIEGIIWILLSIALAALVGRKPSIAAVFIGLAAAMKIYPAALLLMFLVKKQYRYVIISGVTACIATVVSLAAIGPSISAAAGYLVNGLHGFQDVFALQYNNLIMGFDHSLFSMYKQIVALLVRPDRRPAVLAFSSNFYLAGVLILTGALIWLRVRKLPRFNVLLFSCVIMVLFPFVSADYTLIHMYLPWSMLIYYLLHDSWRDPYRPSDRMLVLVLFAFAALFAPETYLLFEPKGELITGFGGQVKGLILVFLLWASVSVPLGTSAFGDLQQSRPVEAAAPSPEEEFTPSRTPVA